MTDVTIMTAIYKAGDFIENFMSEIVRQTIFNRCKLVLLNCQNLHNERQIYKPYLGSNVVSIEYPEYVKLYHTWNNAMYFYPSKYFISANIDDRWRPDYLEQCVAFLDMHSEFGVVAGGVDVTDTKNCTWPVWQVSDTMSIMYPGSTMGPSPMWRKELIDKWGGFSNYYSIGDARLWEIWHANGVRFGTLPETYILYYRNPESLERRRDNDSGKLLSDIDRFG